MKLWTCCVVSFWLLVLAVFAAFASACESMRGARIEWVPACTIVAASRPQLVELANRADMSPEDFARQVCQAIDTAERITLREGAK